jgi:hypothetical protein
LSQSISVISGALAAIAYAAAITGTGAALLWLGFRQRLADRPLVLGLLSLILGQGVVAVVWLAMALAGALRPAAVGLFTILGCLVLAVICRGQIRLAARPTSQPLPTFEAWIGRLVVVVLALRAIATMAPTRNDDALLMYLFTPRTIALEQGLSFQPFVMRHGLMPLQVEMHSAALFSLSNLTAVTVWDYLCSLSVLAAVWLIAVELASDEGIALIAVLIVVTTPAFALMMGAGKVDNAATQYGLAAVLWLLIGGRAGLVNGGLCVGWSIAARYTGVLMVPACAYLIGFSRGARERVKPAMAIAAVAAVAAAAPMAIKNLLLVGHPLAPMLGPADAFWVWRDYQGATRNLTWADVPLFPFIWTFGERSAMLGNISPLLLGLLPFSLLYRSAPEARRTRPALVTGSLIVLTWLLLQPRTMMTRYVLAGICLIAIGVAPALRLAYNEMGVSGRRITVTALLLLLGFWLVASRAAGRQG